MRGTRSGDEAATCCRGHRDQVRYPPRTSPGLPCGAARSERRPHPADDNAPRQVSWPGSAVASPRARSTPARRRADDPLLRPVGPGTAQPCPSSCHMLGGPPGRSSPGAETRRLPRPSRRSGPRTGREEPLLATGCPVREPPRPPRPRRRPDMCGPRRAAPPAPRAHLSLDSLAPLLCGASVAHAHRRTGTRR